MRCPSCDGECRVLESRPSRRSIRRRRECKLCRERFTTTEIIIAEHAPRAADDVRARGGR